MKPIFKYRGGKARELSEIEKHIPTSFDRYLEPFVGGGAVFFHLEHENSIINDINSRLIQAYKEIKHSYPVVRGELDALQIKYESNREIYERNKKERSSRVEDPNEPLYYSMREEYNKPTESWNAATLYYFINKTAYSGMIRHNKKGEFNVPYGRYKNFNTKLLTAEHQQLLSTTKIFNKSYEDIFRMAEPDDFMFLDPPYDCVFTSYGNEVSDSDFLEKEQIKLATRFKKLQCKALMIISKTELTEELYSKYIVDEYNKGYSVNIRNRFKNEAVHLVIKNRAF